MTNRDEDLREVQLRNRILLYIVLGFFGLVALINELMPIFGG